MKNQQCNEGLEPSIFDHWNQDLLRNCSAWNYQPVPSGPSREPYIFFISMYLYLYLCHIMYTYMPPSELRVESPKSYQSFFLDRIRAISKVQYECLNLGQDSFISFSTFRRQFENLLFDSIPRPNLDNSPLRCRSVWIFVHHHAENGWCTRSAHAKRKMRGPSSCQIWTHMHISEDLHPNQFHSPKKDTEKQKSLGKKHGRFRLLASKIHWKPIPGLKIMCIYSITFIYQKSKDGRSVSV